MIFQISILQNFTDFDNIDAKITSLWNSDEFRTSVEIPKKIPISCWKISLQGDDEHVPPGNGKQRCVGAGNARSTLRPGLPPGSAPGQRAEDGWDPNSRVIQPEKKND